VLFALKWPAAIGMADTTAKARTRKKTATASDLGNFGTREWIRGILTAAAGAKHFGATEERSADRRTVTRGDWRNWVRKETSTAKKVKPEELDAVVEFLASLSDHKEIGPLDQEKIKAGMAFFAQGTDATSGACYDCHAMKVAEDPEGFFSEPSAQISTGAPDLTGYGSAEWLNEFIPPSRGIRSSTPATTHMPAFAEQLSEKEFDLLVEWMLHNWPPRRHSRHRKMRLPAASGVAQIARHFRRDSRLSANLRAVLSGFDACVPHAQSARCRFLRRDAASSSESARRRTQVVRHGKARFVTEIWWSLSPVLLLHEATYHGMKRFRVFRRSQPAVVREGWGHERNESAKKGSRKKKAKKLRAEK